MCGANGATMTTSGSTSARAAVRPPARTAFRYSISAAIDVLYCSSGELLGDLLDGLVQLPLDVGVRRADPSADDHRVPQAMQEAERSLDALGAVVAAFLERARGT